VTALQKDVQIKVVGNSAKGMLKEIECNERKEKQLNFLDSLQETVKEFEECKRAGGS